MIVSEDAKKKMKNLLASYLDHEQEKKEIAENEKAIFKEAAELAEKKPAAIRKKFGELKKRYETGKDDSTDLAELDEFFS
jgi:hypothetical protein